MRDIIVGLLIMLLTYFSTPSLESVIADKQSSLRERGSTMQPIERGIGIHYE